MKRKTLSSMLIALLLTTEAITISPFASTKATTCLTPCGCEGNRQCDVKSDSNKKHKDSKEDIGFWKTENTDLLNDAQKNQLKSIRDKVEKGEPLTEEDKKALFELKDAIAKAKLGEEKFNKFKALIEKKKNHEELTDEEKQELKSYFKELK